MMEFLDKVGWVDDQAVRVVGVRFCVCEEALCEESKRVGARGVSLDARGLCNKGYQQLPVLGVAKCLAKCLGGEASCWVVVQLGDRIWLLGSVDCRLGYPK